MAIVIIDEQHKFGIKQREKISSDYEKQPHLIYMSATPIPRTLALVLYENMNYITIPDKPSNRDITKTIVYRYLLYLQFLCIPNTPACYLEDA